MKEKTGCLVCGQDLKYLKNRKKVECYFCGKKFETLVTCDDGHFVCDSCHSLSADEFIEKTVIESEEKNPLELAEKIMKNTKIKMHGPEHHFLVPAVLIAVYYNIRNKPDLKKEKIKEAKKRAEKILGGFCGSHGVCGGAVGTGIFISIITGATPLSRKEWKLSNRITSKSLEKIAYYGGPRCCKRNTLLSILGAVSFVQKELNINIPTNPDIICDFSDLNKDCIEEKCPFYRF